jgi:hypothetical protein
MSDPRVQSRSLKSALSREIGRNWVLGLNLTYDTTSTPPAHDVPARDILFSNCLTVPALGKGATIPCGLRLALARLGGSEIRKIR